MIGKSRLFVRKQVLDQTVAIELVHSFRADNSYIAERRLHEHFASKRRQGEWFTLSDADVNLIRAIRGYESGDFVTGFGSFFTQLGAQ